jgi:hypothetical protein
VKIQLLNIKLTYRIAIFLLLHANAFSQPIEQQSSETAVLVIGGYHSVKFNDQTFSKVSQNANGWILGADLRIKGSKIEHIVALNFAKASIKSKNLNGSSSYNNAGYWILKNFNLNEDKSLVIGAGAGISAFYFSRSYEDLINNNYTREAALCMDIGINIQWWPLAANHRLSITNFLRSNVYSLSAQPLFGAYAWQIPSDQPDATKSMFSSAKATGPQNMLLIVNELSMTYAISKSWTAGIRHQFSYGNFSVNREVTWNANNFTVICKLTF